MKITVADISFSRRVNARLVSRIAAAVLKILKKTGDIRLNLIFLDDKAIRRINRRFKGSDRPTDVLSFPLGTGSRGTGKYLGEIYISVDRAAAQSKIFDSDINEELVRYVIHGILHLFGYDDMTKTGRRKMSAREDEILRCLSRKEDLSKVLTRL